MKINLNKNNYQQLISGASIFTTGGGVPFEDQIESLKKLPKISSRILSLDEFPKGSYICTAAELGPTDVPPLKKDMVIKKMLDLLMRVTGKKINGLYAPEIGQESIILESSNYLKLPIADFDPAGFRAVPFIDINLFNLKNLDFTYTPMVASDDRDEIFLIDGDISYERLENILRDLTQFSKQGVVFLLGGVLSVDRLLSIGGFEPSYTQAFKIGGIKQYDQLIASVQPKSLIEGMISGINEFNEKGFSGSIISVKSKSRKNYKLIVLNEVIYILDQSNNILFSVPDRILLIDPENLRGFSAVKLTKGQRLTIAITDPVGDWKQKRAQKIFGPKRFSFLLENLKKS